MCIILAAKLAIIQKCRDFFRYFRKEKASTKLGSKNESEQTVVTQITLVAPIPCLRQPLAVDEQNLCHS